MTTIDTATTTMNNADEAKDAEITKTRTKALLNVVKTPSIVGHESGSWSRFFTKDGVHPFDEIKWKTVDGEIVGVDGSTKWSRKNLEVPDWWDQNTVNIICSKYFRNVDGELESSVKQMILRVVNVIVGWAVEQEYFNSDKDAQVYSDELCYALLHQYGAFNSPVWFNLGVPDRKQMASACFISHVDDSLDAITKFAASELTIFAGGSGSGANLSNLRSSYERLSTGALVSGPIAWMRMLDQGALAMKSGGSTRNAAKMIVLDIDHPDVLETQDGRPGFIRCKAVEEKRAHDLIDAGYSAAFDDPNSAYKNVMFQNANHSLSVSNSFMTAVERDDKWVTKRRLDGSAVKEYDARDVWREIAEATWMCGDPGIQFTDTINKWHTVPKEGRIRSSNPCFHPDTRISTECGLVRIEDLCAEYESEVVKVLVQTADGPVLKEATVFSTGVKNVVEVHTRRGRVLKVTSDHLLKTEEGYVEACALNEDSVLLIQAGEGVHNTDKTSGMHLMWHKIAGWIVGDGWVLKALPCRNTHEVGLLFGRDDKDAMEVVTSFLNEQDVPFSMKRQTGSVGESPDYLRIHRKTIWEAMSMWACEPGSKAPTKRVMDSVFRSTRKEQLAFLAGLFSADGTFNIQPKKNVDARFGSTSLELLRDVQALLLNLGVNSTIYKDRKPNGKSTFSYVTKSGELRTYSSKEKTNDLVITGQSLRTFKELMLSIGLLSGRKQNQFDDVPDTVNNYGRDKWTDEVVRVVDSGEVVPVFDVTEPKTSSLIAGGVVAHNCSEFLHVDNTACNLCALNLLKFFDVGDRTVKLDAFEHAVRLFVTAQNAIVAKADYPTEEIRANSCRLRPIGLNYGNLGSVIMRMGFGYDSDEARSIAARMASLMTGFAYLTSAKLAARVGPFEAFEDNRNEMLGVMGMHKGADSTINDDHSVTLPDDVVRRSADVWSQVIELGSKYGFTNSQATLQAPLGTLSFMLEADTTGIEPAFSLVSYKSLVGGGLVKLVNQGVKDALYSLGYKENVVNDILAYIMENDTIEGSPHLLDNHLEVFDCAMSSGNGKRSLSPLSHLRMMGAIQPLITCAQSKTVNLPQNTTVEEIADVYMEAWKLGLKCVALYRDESKRTQPLSSKSADGDSDDGKRIIGHRSPMPVDAHGHRHRFVINGANGNTKGYIMVNEYPDGSPGEVFLKIGKSGSTVSGLVDGFTQLLSIALQWGVPLDKMIRSFAHTKFEPAGMTKNPEIRFTDSLYDYLFKFLDAKYYGGVNSGIATSYGNGDRQSLTPSSIPPTNGAPETSNTDAPPCAQCGSITRRSGTCYICNTCGTSSGCS